MASRGTRKSAGTKNQTATKGSRESKQNPKDAKELLLRRLQLGSQVFDYTDESKDVKAKAERLTAL